MEKSNKQVEEDKHAHSDECKHNDNEDDHNLNQDNDDEEDEKELQNQIQDVKDQIANTGEKDILKVIEKSLGDFKLNHD